MSATDPSSLLSFILLGCAALPRPASAQLTSCALEGEYLLSGMMDLGTGPLYVGGLFVFQPGTPCAPGVTGMVSITVVYSPPGTSNTLYSANLPYMGDDTLIKIGPGLMQGAPTGIVNGLITSMPMAGDGSLRLTGFLSRQRPARRSQRPARAHRRHRTDRRHRNAWSDGPDRRDWDRRADRSDGSYWCHGARPAPTGPAGATGEPV